MKKKFKVQGSKFRVKVEVQSSRVKVEVEVFKNIARQE